MKYMTLTDINQAMTASEDAMAQADQAFLEELEKVADAIRQTAVERPVILLAGPSGSGKTTTAFLLERFLDNWDTETHTISMDNFFSTMTPQQREMAAKGKLDLESPARVDIPYLNRQLQSIIACKPTWMPRYHFPTTTRMDQDWQLTRKPGELLLLEGIHALNPEVITIPEEMTVRIYVSVRTRVTNDALWFRRKKRIESESNSESWNAWFHPGLAFVLFPGSDTIPCNWCYWKYRRTYLSACYAADWGKPGGDAFQRNV